MTEPKIRVCAEPGCPNLADRTRCDIHHKAKRRTQDKRRPNARQRGYDRTHEQHRTHWLSLFPSCQWPGCKDKATDLDHIDGDPFNKTWANYRGLCGTHHKQRTAQDQPGGWNA